MRKTNKARISLKLSMIGLILGFVTIPGCELMGDLGCPCSRDTPWTSDHAKYCYASQGQCASETGEHCYECSK